MTKSRYSLVFNEARLSTSDSILVIVASTSAIFASSTVVSASAVASTVFYFYAIRAYNLSKAY